jgi:hypothetical protein
MEGIRNTIKIVFEKPKEEMLHGRGYRSRWEDNVKTDIYWNEVELVVPTSTLLEGGFGFMLQSHCSCCPWKKALMLLFKNWIIDSFV